MAKNSAAQYEVVAVDDEDEVQWRRWRRQQQRQAQCQSLVRMRKGISQQQENVNGVNANQRSNKGDTADQLDGACRGAQMPISRATK